MSARYIPFVSIVFLVSAGLAAPAASMEQASMEQAEFKAVRYPACYGLVSPYENPSAATLTAGTAEEQLQAETVLFRDTLSGASAAQNCYSVALKDTKETRGKRWMPQERTRAQMTELREGGSLTGQILARAIDRFRTRSAALTPELTSSLAPAAGGGGGMGDAAAERVRILTGDGTALLERARGVQERQTGLESALGF